MKILNDFNVLIQGNSDVYDYDVFDLKCIDRDVSFIKIIAIPCINGNINGLPIIMSCDTFKFDLEYHQLGSSIYNECVVYAINILSYCIIRCINY